MSVTALPAIANEGGLVRYLQEIKQFPMLDDEEEYMLAKRWREFEDVQAAHKLVTSHLRLVAKMAMGYRHYGLPIADLIAEGNVGLMRAVKKFDPERGFRLATYAMWWIKASLHEYVLNSWSMVKLGSVAAQKKLFFNLRRMKKQLMILDSGDLTGDQAQQIAASLDVAVEDVHHMNRRLSGRDASLNAPVAADGHAEVQDFLADESDDQETVLARRQEQRLGHKLLVEALDSLNERERHIITERRLRENPVTLEELGQHYGVSRERIRQIENRAFDKLQTHIRNNVALA